MRANGEGITMNTIIQDQRRGSTRERLRPAPSYSHPVTITFEIQNHTTRMQKLTKAFKVYRLTVLSLLCLVVGLVVGLLSRPFAKDWTERQFMYIEMPGELYLRLLKLMIIPLLVSNVILSFGSIQGKTSSHLGKIASFLYLGSNVAAITAAVVVVTLMSPGKNQQTSLNNFGSLIQIGNHHFFHDYHDSVRRYRDSHPMFYHTDRSGLDELGYSAPGTTKVSYTDAGNAEATTTEQPEQRQQEQIVIHKVSQGQIGSTGGSGSSSQTFSIPFVKQTKLNYSFASNPTPQVGLSTKLPIDVLLDVLRNLVPDSIVGATMLQSRTRLFAPKELIIGKNGSINPPPSRWPMGHDMVDQANIIGLLAISVLTGVILSYMEEASKPMLDLCACISELSLRVGMMIINLTPFCIMFLLIAQLARARDLSSIVGNLFMYSITVITALIFHGFVVLPLVYYLITKKSPIRLLMGMLEALVASFATSSSSATMALSLNCLSELELNPVIVRAFGPLGSVFNMNGTAIYETISVIFIAQTLGVTLPLTSLLLVGLSAAVASLSTAGIPSSGVTTMVIVLNAVNLPALQLSLIYIVDFIIDRFRTVINVWSGAIVCALIDHICPEHLFEEEMQPEKYREMQKYRASKGTLTTTRRSVVAATDENLKPQVISVTITPPCESSSM